MYPYLFSFFRGKEKIIVPLEVSLAGLPLDRDLSYKVAVNEQYTTADSKYFKLPENLVFEKWKVKGHSKCRADKFC